jgi:hypothetical protein
LEPYCLQHILHVNDENDPKVSGDFSNSGGMLLECEQMCLCASCSVQKKSCAMI